MRTCSRTIPLPSRDRVDPSPATSRPQSDSIRNDHTINRTSEGQPDRVVQSVSCRVPSACPPTDRVGHAARSARIIHDVRDHLARGDRRHHPTPAAGGVEPIQLHRRPGAGHLRLRRLHVPNRRAVGIRPRAADVGCEGVPEPAADVRADHRDAATSDRSSCSSRAHRRSSP